MKKYGQFLYVTSEWITRFAAIHFLWVFFTLAGLVIFGLMPSTAALYSIMRKWIQGERDLPLWKTYWKIYKQEWKPANRLLFFVVPLLFIMAIHIAFLSQNESFGPAHLSSFVFLFFFILIFLYVFPAYVHFDMGLLSIMKNAFLIMLISPLHDILLLISLSSLLIIFFYFPGIAFFFGISSAAWINTYLCLHAFDRISQKKNS
ncbi:MAG: DUF624 domain-containing protein [Brevibacillus sp.]|nr:DUF624 domain-containing protein [Brevibacillus sp.]